MGIGRGLGEHSDRRGCSQLAGVIGAGSRSVVCSVAEGDELSSSHDSISPAVFSLPIGV